MKETELKPCDAPLKASERYIQIRDALDFQLRFAAFSKTDSIVISVHDARMLFEAADIVAEILKVKEADNEQREADN